MFWTRRLKPSFIIIGGIKCASSSFYRYIIDHPNVLPSAVKETNFFSNKGLIKALIGLPSYLKLFPEKESSKDAVLEWYKLDKDERVQECEFVKKRKLNTSYITGEATATYNFSANPRVIKTLFPKVKVIALVRNPVDRFISHHKMLIRFHNEGRKGYDVGELLDFTKKEISLFKEGKTTRLLHQGLYYQYLSKWESVFGRGQFVLFKSEDLKKSETSINILNKTCRFLNIESYNFSDAINEKFNVAPKSQINAEAKLLLEEFYAPYNEKFHNHFGINVDS